MKLRLVLRLADELMAFKLGHCGPSDDPDKQTAYLAGFNDIAIRFIAAGRRLGDPELTEMLDAAADQPEHIVEAYTQRANLIAAIEYLKQAAEQPSYENDLALNTAFVAPELLAELRAFRPAKFDFKKLIAFCEELNDAYRRGAYLSTALLIRAVMNHVPPVFGHTTFAAVVAQAGRSIKPMLERLESEARPIADLHTHILIREHESLPTKNQVEPFKGAFELLLHEVLARAA
jgi:hypothetical protein